MVVGEAEVKRRLPEKNKYFCSPSRLKRQLMIFAFLPICDMNSYTPIPNPHSLSYSNTQSIPLIGSADK
jgi:hypothetical protein